MDALQIYDVVNSITSQALGRTDLTVVNTQGLVSLGNVVLESTTHSDDFLNVLVKRIGKTILSNRAYKNKFNTLMKDGIEWGAIVQKLSGNLPTAEKDESFNLENGGSIDHYKINKPDIKQKLFITNAPYQFHITVQRVHFKEAFTSEQAMEGFIGMIYGLVQNAIEKALEELGRTTLNNYIAEIADTDRVVKLGTLYNEDVDVSEQLADVKARRNSKEFWHFAVAKIKEISDYMTSINTLYNDGTVERHTPKELQKLLVLSNCNYKMETISGYEAFNKDYVELNNYETIPYLQSIKEPNKITIGRASDNEQKSIDNVMAVLFDTDALGSYTQDQWTATTPMNAAGGYFNTYWHEKQLWFNDLSEQFVCFTLD